MGNNNHHHRDHINICVYERLAYKNLPVQVRDSMLGFLGTLLTSLSKRGNVVFIGNAVLTSPLGMDP